MFLKYKEHIPELKFTEMDVQKMHFNDHSFDVVIDKACFDANLCGDDSVKNTEAMLGEIHRVLN